MNNSKLKIFSIYVHIDSLIRRKKYLFRERVSSKQSYYGRSKEVILKKVFTIYNSIENNYYTEKDFVVSYIYLNRFKKLGLIRFNRDTVKESKEAINATNLKNDIAFVEQLLKKIGKEEEVLYEVNSFGKSILFDLTQKNVISISYSIKNANRLKEISNDDKAFRSYKYYVRACRLIHDFLKVKEFVYG